MASWMSRPLWSLSSSSHENRDDTAS
jgi:hypothetical protein